jgi:hypothetical protein
MIKIFPGFGFQSHAYCFQFPLCLFPSLPESGEFGDKPVRGKFFQRHVMPGLADFVEQPRYFG